MWISAPDAEAAAVTGSTAWAAAAAVTAAAAAVTRAQSWGRVAIEASVETCGPTLAHGVQRSQTLDASGGFLFTPLQTSTPGWLVAQEREVPMSTCMRLPFLRSSEHSTEWQTQVPNAVSQKPRDVDLVRKDILQCRVILVWHAFAVKSGQALRRADRHARGIWLRRLVRYWQSVAKDCSLRSRGCAAELERKRTERFVHQNMHRLRVLAIFKRRRILTCYRRALAAFELWRVILALSRLQQRVAARKKRDSSLKVLLALAASAFQASACRNYLKQRNSRIQRHVMHTMQTWLHISRALNRLEIRAQTTLLQRSVEIFSSRAHLSNVYQRLCSQFSRKLLQEAFGALHTWFRLTMTLQALRRRHSVKLLDGSFRAMRTWAKLSATQMETCNRMRALCAGRQLRETFSFLRTWLRLTVTLRLLRSQHGAKLVLLAFRVLHKSASLKVSLKKISFCQQTPLLRAALLGIQMLLQVSRAAKLLQTRRDLAICREAFKIFCTTVQFSVSLRESRDQRKQALLLAVIQAMHARWQEATRVKNTLQSSRALQEDALRRSAFETFRQHIQILALLHRLKGQQQSTTLRAAFQALHVCAKQAMQAKQALLAIEFVRDAKMHRRVFAALRHAVQLAACLRSCRQQREKDMLRGAFRALHSSCQREVTLKVSVRHFAGVRNASACLQAFATFKLNARIAMSLQCIRNRREGETLKSVLGSFQVWVQNAVSVRQTLQTILGKRLQQQKRICFSVLCSRAQRRLLLRDICASTSATVERRKRRHAVSFWYAASVRAKSAKNFAISRTLCKLRQILSVMHRAVVDQRRGREAVMYCEASFARRVISAWSLAAKVRRHVRALPAASALTARCCLAHWVYQCPALAILVTWQIITVHIQCERQALHLAEKNTAKHVRMMLLAWSAVATRSKAVLSQFRWRFTLRCAALLLQAWSRRTHLVAAARTRYEHCSWRSCQWSLRWWRFAAVGRRAELELQVGALRAWGFGAAQGRRARDETLRGRWVDEVAEAFAMRRLLRFVLHGFAWWSLHASDVRTLRVHHRSAHERHLKCLAFLMLRQTLALARFVSLDALLNGRSALAALGSWRLAAKGLLLASMRQRKSQAAAWSAFRTGGQRRRGGSRLASMLERHLCSWATGHWQGYLDNLQVAEVNACRRISDLRCAGALRALRMHGRVAAQKNLLPGVLRAWRQACREAQFVRRSRLSHGIRALRSYARARWTLRRRLAVAGLLATRRRLRAVWLPWQLLCFTETPSHDMLLEHWSDAVAAPGVLQPLVGLQACSLTNGPTSTNQKHVSVDATQDKRRER